MSQPVAKSEAPKSADTKTVEAPKETPKKLSAMEKASLVRKKAQELRDAHPEQFGKKGSRKNDSEGYVPRGWQLALTAAKADLNPSTKVVKTKAVRTKEKVANPEQRLKEISSKAQEMRTKDPVKYGIPRARKGSEGYVAEGWKQAVRDATKALGY